MLINPSPNKKARCNAGLVNKLVSKSAYCRSKKKSHLRFGLYLALGSIIFPLPFTIIWPAGIFHIFTISAFTLSARRLLSVSL